MVKKRIYFKGVGFLCIAALVALSVQHFMIDHGPLPLNSEESFVGEIAHQLDQSRL